MGFGKAFGFGLLAFIGLNFLFVIISFTISGDLNQLFADIGANPLILLLIMFGPIANLPGTVFTSIYTNLASGITVTGSTVPLLIIYGVVNGIFYGCFALLFAKTEYY